MESDAVVTIRDNSEIPEVVLRAALSAFVAYCSADSLAVVHRTAVALPEGHRVQEDVQILLFDPPQHT